MNVGLCQLIVVCMESSEAVGNLMPIQCRKRQENALL